MTTEERARRVHGIVYSCDGREELAERIVALEELVADLFAFVESLCDICGEEYCFNYDEDNNCCSFETRSRELGIEV